MLSFRYILVFLSTHDAPIYVYFQSGGSGKEIRNFKKEKIFPLPVCLVNSLYDNIKLLRKISYNVWWIQHNTPMAMCSAHFQLKGNIKLPNHCYPYKHSSEINIDSCIIVPHLLIIGTYIYSAHPSHLSI